ncbi:MAG: HD domain-containing protein [Bulleidia sp.]|nr:HD domain-containing protein [Bulleidia sp.]
MNRQDAVNAFEAYVSVFDLNDGMMKLKHEHSYRVADLCAEFAKSLSADEDLAYRIGLVHDIGRFEQARKYHSFLDYQTMDHGDFGAALLKENDYVLNYADPNEADIMIQAVRNHNKYAVEEGLSETALLYARILRDADKTDILYLRGCHSYDSILKIDRDAIEHGTVSPYVYSEAMQDHVIISSKRVTKLDRVVSMACLVYDMNWTYGIKTALENHYIEKLFDLYDYQNAEGKQQIKEIREHVLNYMKMRLQEAE